MANVRNSIDNGENVAPVVPEIEIAPPVVVVVPEIEIAPPVVVPENRPIPNLMFPVIDGDKVVMMAVPPLILHGDAELKMAEMLRRSLLPPPPTPAARSGGGGYGFHHGNTSSGGDDSMNMTTDFIKLCFTCKKEIGNIVDNFMYKDKYFCSDDCRTQEMEKDTEEELNNRERVRMYRRRRRNQPPKGDDDNAIFSIGDN